MQQASLNPLCEELYGAPHVTIHRADLLDVIASGFPVEHIHLGHRLTGLEDKGNSIEAWFENGVRVTADILVGADGINSTVRAVLFGEEAPVFARCVAYRGLVPAEGSPISRSRPVISLGSAPGRILCTTRSHVGGS